MSEQVETGLVLLLIGMSTVFFVLGLVVLTGRVLIATLNKIGGSAVTIQARQATQGHEDNLLSPRKKAAIAAAIHLATGGAAKPTNVQKQE